MPISVQEQKDKPSKIYTYQQPVPKLKKNAYLFGYFCGNVGDLKKKIKKSNVWFVYNLTMFWVSGGEKEFVKKKIQIKA